MEVVIFLAVVVFVFFVFRPKKSVRFVRTVSAPLSPHKSTRKGTLSGRAYVIDGDTIIIKKTKIRLFGIDAPELDQPWGQVAKWAMVRLCQGQVIRAELTGETSHDRFVATCYLPDGSDIGAELIRQGLAVDYGKFSGGKYREFETAEGRKRFRRGAYRW